VLERAAPMAETRDAARKVDWKAQSDERNEKLVDVEESERERLVELEAEPSFGDRQPERYLAAMAFARCAERKRSGLATPFARTDHPVRIIRFVRD
jgi:hypothetical protein